tara:strand:- start:166 stop:318 length:153 start_codon:yes stop_codon:yes gene_type:complete
MIENKKWFKGCRDRVINTIHTRYINSDNEENLKINNLIKFTTDKEDLKAS